MKSGLRLCNRLLAFAVGLGLSGAAGAASGPSAPCPAPDNSTTITNCFFDLTKSGQSAQAWVAEVLSGGLFRTPGEGGNTGQVFDTAQPFVRIQLQEPGSGNPGGIQAPAHYSPSANRPASSPVTVQGPGPGGAWNKPIKLGDVPKVTVCDGGGTTGTNCKQYFEFLLAVSTQAHGPLESLSLDEFKLFVAGKPDSLGNVTPDAGGAEQTTQSHRVVRAPLRVQRPRGANEVPLTGATLKYDMDAAAGGDASILLDYSGGGVDLQALVPVENFAGISADSLVYLHSKFDWTSSQCQHPCKAPDAITVGQFQAGFAEWSIRAPGAIGPSHNPTPPTVLLLAAGLAGLIAIRRGRRASRA